MIQRALHLLAAALRRYPYRGKTVVWTLAQGHLRPDPVFHVRFPGGYSMLLDLSDFWQRQMLAGCYERRMYWLVRSLLRPGDTFIDAGAMVGYYACMAGSVVAHGSVHAFEPHPLTVIELRKQINANPDLAIKVHELALSEIDGSSTLFIPPDTDHFWQRGHSRLSAVAGWRTQQVNCVTLDAFIRSHGIQRVELCKLDIERQEPAALRGARICLRSGVLESVIAEVVDETRDELSAELKPYEFEIIQDLRSIRPVKRFSHVGKGHTNVLLARGVCAQRWENLGWQRWLV